MSSLSMAKKTHPTSSNIKDSPSNTVLFSQNDNFIDWITIHEEHHENLPIINGGLVIDSPEGVKYSQKGDSITIDKITYMTAKFYQHKGSFETSIAIRCDGSRVTLSGNVGRFNRPDNVWGFSFFEVLDICNTIMRMVGLPPFSTRAHCSRLDYTANFATGSQQNANEVFAYLETQTMPYLKKGRSGNSTVRYGTMKGRRSLIIYDKAKEMNARGAQGDEYLKKLADFLQNNGVIRFESRYGRKYISENTINNDITSSVENCSKAASTNALNIIQIIRIMLKCRIWRGLQN